MSSDQVSYGVEFDLDAIARETARRIAEAHDQRVFEILKRTYGFVRPVRCRDCKHFGESYCYRLGEYREFMAKPDGFCAWGERREDE